MRIALTASGTHGDVRPTLAPREALHRAGHTVAVALAASIRAEHGVDNAVNWISEFIARTEPGRVTEGAWA